MINVHRSEPIGSTSRLDANRNTSRKRYRVGEDYHRAYCAHRYRCDVASMGTTALLPTNLSNRLVDLYPVHCCGCCSKVLIIFPAEDTQRPVTNANKNASRSGAKLDLFLSPALSLPLILETRKLNLLHRAYRRGLEAVNISLTAYARGIPREEYRRRKFSPELREEY